MTSSSSVSSPFDRSQKQTVTLLRHLEGLFQEFPIGPSSESSSTSELRKEFIRLLFMAMTTSPSKTATREVEERYQKLFDESPPSALFPLDSLIEKLYWTCSLFNLTPSHLGSVYEMLLLEAKKKKAGSFYTPYPLAQAMAQNLIHYLPKQSETPLQILDPAVGGGVFLQALQDSQNDPQTSLSLYGWDQDPDIIESTRLSLWWESGCPDELKNFKADELKHGDSLIQNDSPALLFDAIIGNPPYLSVKQGLDPEKRTLYEVQYQCAQGQYDLYSLFIEQGLKLLKPHGILIFLLPKPLLVNDQQRPIREILLQHKILEIWDVGKDAFVPKAAVESTVIIVKKLPEDSLLNSSHHFKRIEWIKKKQKEEEQKRKKEKGIKDESKITQLAVQTGEIQQSILSDFPEKNLNLWFTPENIHFLKTIEIHSVSFKNWLTNADETPNGRGMEIGKNQCRRSPKEGFQSVLTGQDLTAFSLPQSPNFYTEFNPSDTKHHKNLALYQSPKLMVRRVADRPIAAVDENENALTLNTLYNFHLKNPELYPIACALMNSDTLARWLKERFYFSERLFPYLRQQQILALPMPTEEALNQLVPPPLGQNIMTYKALITQLYNELKTAKANKKDTKPFLKQLNNVVSSLFELS